MTIIPELYIWLGMLKIQINGEELIFDNIHNEGITKQEWLGKFYCLAIELGGQFEITEIDF